jgi:hypothetical protein
VSSGTITIPSSSLPISAITNLTTQLSDLSSSITNEITKGASDKSELLLKINSLSSTFVTTTSLTSQLSSYCPQTSYTALKTQADAATLLLSNTQYVNDFGLNWYGNMNVFGTLFVTVNNISYNVGNILKDLSSIYATKTYVDGKVSAVASSLSSDTMTTRTSTQIGYQVSTTTLLKTDTITSTVKLAELSGLSPIGSVWIVEAVVQQTNSTTLLPYYIEVQEGATYTANSGIINGTNIITINRNYNSGQTAVKQKYTTDSTSAVYVVSGNNTSGKLSLGGSFSSVIISGILLKATRIA